MDSFGELASFVLDGLNWGQLAFTDMTHYSRETYFRIRNKKKRSWDASLVLTFCWATQVSRAVSECLLTAAGYSLNEWSRADHRALVFMLEEMRGMSAVDWNNYMRKNELPYRVKEKPTAVKA
jgi:hypothetical protein